jgi:hypothetical protein
LKLLTREPVYHFYNKEKSKIKILKENNPVRSTYSKKEVKIGKIIIEEAMKFVIRKFLLPLILKIIEIVF